MKSDPDRLRDIIEAIDRIDRYARRGRGAFEQDELIQNWMLRHLQIIGEATARLHSALGYLRPVDYYRGDPRRLHGLRRLKLEVARHARKEANLKLRQLTLPLMKERMRAETVA